MLTLVAWPVVAAAATGVVLVDDDATFERTLGTGGDETTDIVLSNPTSKRVHVYAVRQGGTIESCQPDSKRLTIPRQQEKTFSIKFSNCPKEDDPNVNFILADKPENGTNVLGTKILKTTPPTAAATPDWSVFLYFAWSAIVGLILVLIAYRTWDKVSTEDPAHPKPKWGDGLPGLSSSWSFQDSWASNATVVAALFAGLFNATDVTTTLLGDEAKNVTTVVAVAVAFGVGLTTLAPLVLQACRTVDDSLPTMRGIVAAGTLTLAGTGGELWVTIITVHNTKAMNHGWLLLAGIVGSALIAVYAITTTWQSISTGVIDPNAEDDSAPAPLMIPWTAALALVHDVVGALHRRGVFVDDFNPDEVRLEEIGLGPEGILPTSVNIEGSAGSIPVLVAAPPAPRRRTRRPSPIL
jgi:hypothetical protein